VLQEVAAERDVLQERMEEQLLKISALQSRLDEQRQKADSQLKEANLELQTKVRDQEKELNRLLETIENREQEVCNKEVICRCSVKTKICCYWQYGSSLLCCCRGNIEGISFIIDYVNRPVLLITRQRELTTFFQDW
jgi:hypothetical protein